MKDVLQVWREVFSNWRYLTLGIFILFLFYTTNIIIVNFKTLTHYFRQSTLIENADFLFSLFVGFKDTVLFSSFVSLIMIGILFGMLFSLIAYKTIMIKNAGGKTMGFLGTTGIFLGVLAPGCAACGIGLLSVFGISAAFLTFLPFDGLEISILAIGILGFSIFKASKDIKKGIVCEIK